MWECDGCGRRGTAEEVDKHILGDNPDPKFNNLRLIKCWGRYEVGSEAYKQWKKRKQEQEQKASK